MENNTIEKGKTLAYASYITLIGTIITLFMNLENKNEYASFHIRQALGLNILFYVISYFVGYFDSIMISGAFYVFFIVLWAYGFITALQGQTTPMPILGSYFQKWFKSI